MKASFNSKCLKEKVKHYFAVTDPCENQRVSFYANDDVSAYSFACSHFAKGVAIYANIGGGIFLGNTK